MRVHGDDWDRMDDRARELTEWTSNRCFMRIEDGHCAALVVTDIEAGLFACGIYETRPETCRTLERGSGACLGELHTKATRPEALLVRLRRGEGRNGHT